MKKRMRRTDGRQGTVNNQKKFADSRVEGIKNPSKVEAFDVLASLWAVAHGMESRSKLMLANLGITGSQRFVLRIIGINPGISAAELAAKLHVDPSTLTGVLGRLEARKLIQRKSAKEDARRAVLTLSESGKKLNKMNRGTIEFAVAAALASLSDTQKRHAKIVLDKIARELEE